jgi:hypothetical protein
MLELVVGGPDEERHETSVAWLGLPRYRARRAGRGLGACGPLRERSVWVRAAGVVEGMDSKLRKTILSQWNLADLMLQNRLRNSVTIFADWQTLLIADLQRAILADAAAIAALETRVLGLLLQVHVATRPTRPAHAHGHLRGMPCPL